MNLNECIAYIQEATFPRQQELYILEHLLAYKKIKEELEKEAKTSSKKEVDEFFDSIWTLYPNKKGKSAVKPTQRKKLFKIGYSRLKEAINEYKKDKDLKINGGFKIFQNGSTFFNGRYEDYILEKTNIKTKKSTKLEFVEREI